MKKRLPLIAVAVFCFVMLVFTFTPVPSAVPQNCKTQTGVVERIFSPCCFDVAFKLKNDPHQYYINRGLENGEVNLEKMRALILGKKVAFEVIQTNWTPLDPQNRMAPVAEIRSNDQVLFSRMKIG